MYICIYIYIFIAIWHLGVRTVQPWLESVDWQLGAGMLGWVRYGSPRLRLGRSASVAQGAKHSENLQETMVFTIKYRGFRFQFSHHPILWFYGTWLSICVSYHYKKINMIIFRWIHLFIAMFIYWRMWTLANTIPYFWVYNGFCTYIVIILFAAHPR